MNAAQIILLLAQLAQAGVELKAQMQKAADLVSKLQAEGRDATPEEWAELEASYTTARRRLDVAIAAAKAKEQGLTR